MIKARLPRVSVIVHAAAGRDARSTLDSVLRQTIEDVEVLVAVPGTASPHEIEPLDGIDPRVALVVSPDTDLPARVRNRCLRVAKGNFVAFVEAGDQWRPDKLERQMNVMRESPRLAMSFTDAEGEGFQPSPERSLVARDGSEFLGALLRRHFVPLSGVMVRASALRVLDGFDESTRLRGFEDYEMWLRLAIRGDAVAAIPEPLARIAPPIADARRLREETARRTILRRIERRGPQLAPEHDHVLRNSLASTLRDIGCAWLGEARVHRSRRYFHTSIRTRPVQLRGYALLALSFLNKRLATRVVRRRLAR